MNKITKIQVSDGAMVGALESADRSMSFGNKLRQFLWRRRHFFAVVLLPTLIVGAYYLLIAADQYESEAHLMVRSAGGDRAAPSGLEAMLKTVGVSDSGSQAAPLADYLGSHDAVNTLRRDNALVERYLRPEADFFAKLSEADPSDETLRKYIRNRIDVRLDTDTNIIMLKVRSFRPNDSFEVIDALLNLGERRVNALNRRAYEAAEATSRRQLIEAEKSLRDAQIAMTGFRQGQGDIDPEGSGEAQLKLVTELRKEQVMAGAQMQVIASQIGTGNPQYAAMQARSKAITGQLASQESVLVGNKRSIADRLGNYQELQLRQEFEAKRYSVASAAVQSAREQATRQQLFVVRLVEPNYPVEATYPKGLKNTITIFLALVLFYGIGWLLLAGVREHAS